MRPKKEDSDLRRNLSKRWYNMMSRCNNENHPSYSNYGGAGVIVDERWANKENFLEDVKSLSGYDKESILTGKLHLDKDTIDPDNKIYSPEKCVFISLEENNKTKPNQMKTFMAFSPGGQAFEGNNQSCFAEKHGLIQTSISACLRGDRPHHKGWTFKYKE